eukprot:TRINITY_DN10131_c0_g1_i1.p1 TRINITY_DN10131_c0_g1~~TRINITY_DN10131_c0_g1_i1.p1  ORF type:complete len:527 (-),score=86.79 TRINITY_DN10131_c0_g1_i1:1401-2825(-)
MDETKQLSNGVGESFVVGVTGSNGGNQVRRGLLRFNLTQLWDMIQSFGEFTLYLGRVELTVKKAGQVPVVIDMYPIISPWGQGSSNASMRPGQGVPSQPGDASWLYSFYPTVKWKTPGGDYVYDLTATSQVTSYETYVWTSTSLLVQIRNLATQPENNVGWLFKAKDETIQGSAKEFFGKSIHAGDVVKEPRLVVVFFASPPGWLWIVITLGILLTSGLSFYIFWVVSYRNTRELYTSRDDSEYFVKESESLRQLFTDLSIRVIPMSQIRFGKFIGKGASGTVFSAKLPNNKKVAVKRMNLYMAGDDAEMEAFVDEIKIMSSVEHPNILSIIGIALGEEISDIGLIMALVEHGSLGDVLFKKRKKLLFSQKIDIVSQMAYGIHYLHSVRPQIIHRDLKPGFFFLPVAVNLQHLSTISEPICLSFHPSMITLCQTPFHLRAMFPEGLSRNPRSFNVLCKELQCRFFCQDSLLFGL